MYGQWTYFTSITDAELILEHQKAWLSPHHGTAALCITPFSMEPQNHVSSFYIYVENRVRDVPYDG